MDDCIEWEGATTGRGYGYKWIAGQPRYTHRLVWMEVNGTIPEGMCICHKCDNPSCYNIDHLFLGTLADNMQDCARKGRLVIGNGLKTHCPQGHPYDIANTTIRNNSRFCKACHRISSKEYNRRKRVG